MAFHDKLFPVGISERSRFGVNYKNSVVETGSGRIEVVELWDPSGRTRFDVSTGIRRGSDWSDFLHHFREMRGSSIAFPFWDATDFSTGPNDIQPAAANDVELGVGDGSETRFQLIKDYSTDGEFSSPRIITLPLESTILVSIDGVPQTSGWSWDANSYEIVFSTAPALDEVVAAGVSTFYNRVRYDPATDSDFMRARVHVEGSVDTPIFLVEDKTGTRSPEDMYLGGGRDFGQVTEDVYLTAGDGLAIDIEPDASGLSVYMPPIADFAPGGPWHSIRNTDGALSFALLEYDGTSIATVTAGQTVVLNLRKSGVNTVWGGSVL